MASAIDLTGKRFGKLMVLARVDSDTHGRAQWVCRCDCGGAHIARADNLQAGNVTRCAVCPAMRASREPLTIEAWYHVTTQDQIGGGRTQGTAGFAVARIGQAEIARLDWMEAPYVRRAPVVVVAAMVRALMSAGHIRATPTPRAVRGWIQRHHARITYHSYNEGDAAWLAWWEHTGEWRGAAEHHPDIPMIELED